jgi:hypothetical protein
MEMKEHYVNSICREASHLKVTMTVEFEDKREEAKWRFCFVMSENAIAISSASHGMKRKSGYMDIDIVKRMKYKGVKRRDIVQQ